MLISKHSINMRVCRRQLSVSFNLAMELNSDKKRRNELVRQKHKGKETKSKFQFSALTFAFSSLPVRAATFLFLAPNRCL